MSPRSHCRENNPTMSTIAPPVVDAAVRPTVSNNFNCAMLKSLLKTTTVFLKDLNAYVCRSAYGSMEMQLLSNHNPHHVSCNLILHASHGPHDLYRTQRLTFQDLACYVRGRRRNIGGVSCRSFCCDTTTRSYIPLSRLETCIWFGPK
jgi:hypothetical protein